MVVTPRDRQAVVLTYRIRQATRVQLQETVFQGLSPSVGATRLAKLCTSDFLLARPLPLVATGRPPNVYCLGAEGVGIVADELGIPETVVCRRQRADARLSFSLYPHRAAAADVYLACDQAGGAHGVTVHWTADEQLARRNLHVKLETGTTLPIRPDGQLVLTSPAGRSVCLLEVQLSSRPATFAHKATAYMAYKGSGQYTAQTGFTSLRVLTLTQTQSQARHHKRAAEQAGGATLFWFATLDDVRKHPYGNIWMVAGRDTLHALLRETAP